MKRLLLLSGLWLALWVCGCSTVYEQQMYEGAKKPAAETALLIVPFTVDLLKFDGDKYKPAPMLSAVKETRLELAPGAHTMVARYSNPYEEPERADRPVWKTKPQQFTLNAEAGRTYRFDVRLPGARGVDGATLQNAVIQILDVTDTAAHPTPVAQPQAAPAEEPAKKQKDSGALKTLKKAWYDASEEEQAEFLEWTEDNR